MATTRRDVENARKAAKASARPDTYTDAYGRTVTFEQALTGAPTLEQTVQERTGLQAGGDRSMFLPYNREMGWHVPEVFYSGIKALVTPDQAYRYGNVTPEEAVEAATAVAGSGLGISSLMKNPTGVMPGKDLGMQIGPKAKTYKGMTPEEDALSAGRGVSPETVREVTGGRLNVSPSGQMFQEISDAASQMKPKEGNFISRAISSFLDKDVGTPKKLGEVLEHPRLYEAYPELEGMKLEFFRGPSKQYGFYDPVENVIAINKNAPKKEQYKTILHEVQHAIQNIEGWSGGASPDRYIPFRLHERGDFASKLYDESVPFYNIPKKVKQKRLKRDVEQEAFQDYLRNEGEANARATERRMGMTDEELRSTPVEYDVPEKEITYFKKGGAVDMPKEYSAGKWKLI